MNADVGIHHAKNSGNKKSSIKDTSTIMRNPSLHIQAKDYAYDCACILDSIAKKTVPTVFRMVHPYIRMIFTLVHIAFYGRCLTYRNVLRDSKCFM